MYSLYILLLNIPLEEMTISNIETLYQIYYAIKYKENTKNEKKTVFEYLTKTVNYFKGVKNESNHYTRQSWQRP